jgi:type I restriction enzyme R subunit
VLALLAAYLTGDPEIASRALSCPRGITAAWREMTNQDIAARNVGYIRQAAIGDPLLPYGQCVEQTLQRLLAARAWTTPQRQWLQRLAARTKANLSVDRAALDDPDLIFKREGGGFNRLFGGALEQVLTTFNDALRESPAA